ncbi:MAG: hypothetical protein M1319_02415 [Chloroflexi bacterium]|nr:hypothetical protein [Chloroflexota bacterium]
MAVMTPTQFATAQPSPEPAEPSVTPTAPPTNVPAAEPTDGPAEETATPVISAPESWLTYVNDVYGYEFRYPEGAMITEAPKDAFTVPAEEADEGVTIDEAYAKWTGKICVKLEYEFVYIIISAPANEGFGYVTCGRTGMAYEGPDREDSLVIDGKPLIAKGFEEQGPGDTLNFHDETLVVVLDDGTRIEYGSTPSVTATYDDYLKLKPELLTIVQSYHTTA